jgi:hypothetical protein
MSRGLLLTYPSDLVDGFRDAGTPCRETLWHQAGHLPIEQVSKFTFMINLKTAKALGKTVPPALLSVADERVHADRVCPPDLKVKIVRVDGHWDAFPGPIDSDAYPECLSAIMRIAAELREQ